MSIEAMKATPHKQLIDELMDSRIPKTEREHAAARGIERLRHAIEAAEKKERASNGTRSWFTIDEFNEWAEKLIEKEKDKCSPDY